MSAINTMASANMEALMRIKYTGLRAEMARREISQRELSRRLDVHQNTVYNWLSGKRPPTLNDVINAFEAIGMDRDDVLGMRLGDLVTIEE